VEKESELYHDHCDAELVGSERILLVDDDMAIIKMAKRKLEWLGYQVRGFTNPEAALKLVQSEPGAFDLIITDMMMPEMNGSQLAEALLKIRPDLPVILCTGYSTLSKEEALKIGICQCFEKPYDFSQLAECIRQVLDGKYRTEN
jgi:two-component system cell cycle sensor histidine kinase/response regulator CckA